MIKGIQSAVEIIGTVAGLARAIGVSPPTVHQWLDGSRPVPAGRCLAIEEATEQKVTRYDLRPDVFGKAPEQAKAA